MPAGSWTFTTTTRSKLLNGTFDLDTDSFKCALLTSASNLTTTSTLWSGVTGEVASGNGYTTGGITVSPLVLAGTTSVTVKFGTNPTWTASGSSLTARFAAVYEVSGSVLCYCLLASTATDVVVTTGNSLTIDGTTTPLFTLA
jgi:hypothetical protein